MEMVLFGLVLLATFNFWVSWRIVKDDLSTKLQRTAQVAFVWLVPLLGALLALHLLKKEPERSSGAYPEPPDVGDDYGYSRANYNNIRRAIDSDGSASGGTVEGAPD